MDSQHGVNHSATSASGNVPWKSLIFKTAGPSIVTIILFLCGSFFIAIPTLRSQLLKAKRQTIKELTASIWRLLWNYNERFHSGELTLKEAQERALERVRAMRYGPEGKDYFWINDMNCMLLMHPYRTELEGTDVSDYADSDGKHLFVEFVKVVGQNDEGFVDYMWQWKDDPNVVVPKISHVRAFKPWGWILGTGMYIEDVDSEISAVTGKLMHVLGGIIAISVLLSAIVIIHGVRVEKERASAEGYLAASERKFRAVFDSTFQHVGLIDPDGRILDVNRTALDFVDAEFEDVAGMFVWESPWWVCSAEEREKLRLAVESCAKGEFVRLETVNTSRHGDRVIIDLTLKPEFGTDGSVTGIIVEGRDINDLKKTEERMAIFRQLVETSSQGVGMADSDGKIVYLNSAGCDMLGLAKSMIIGKSVFSYFRSEDSDDFKSRMMSEANSGRSSVSELQLTDPLKPDSRVLLSVFPIRGERGSSNMVGIILTDVTELQKAEAELTGYRDRLEELVKKRTQELELANDELSVAMASLRNAQTQLVESEKMSSLGGLVAGIAHEVNTPIGVGVTAASHLAEKTSKLQDDYSGGKMTKSSLEKYLKTAADSTGMILTNLQRAAELVQSFKQVAVDQSSEAEREFNLRQYLDEVLLSLHPKYRKTKHKINVECPDYIVLNSYPGAISQIVTNLLMNSLIHGFDGVEEGRVDISVSCWANMVTLEYRDDGNGIAESDLTKIFEPFFTTRRGSGGSGLGMHLVYNLVTQNLGGSIECQSEPGKGVCFTIVFPESLHQKANISRPKMKVLVVDDDSAMRAVCGDSLKGMGCDVLAAGDGEKALSIYEAESNSIDLVILDMVMPGMGGAEVFHRMQSLNKRPKILVASGFTIGGDEAQDLIDSGACGFLKKPYRKADLAKILEEVANA